MNQDTSNKKVTPEVIIQILNDYFDWSTRYMEAARMGDEQLMKQLNDEFDAEKMVRNRNGAKEL